MEYFIGCWFAIYCFEIQPWSATSLRMTDGTRLGMKFNSMETALE